CPAARGRQRQAHMSTSTRRDMSATPYLPVRGIDPGLSQCNWSGDDVTTQASFHRGEPSHHTAQSEVDTKRHPRVRTQGCRFEKLEKYAGQTAEWPAARRRALARWRTSSSSLWKSRCACSTSIS